MSSERRTQGLPGRRRHPSDPLPLPATPGSGRASSRVQRPEDFFSSTTPGPFPGARQRAGGRGDRGGPPRASRALGSVHLEHLALPLPAGGRPPARGSGPASGCHGNPGPNPARPQPKAYPPPAGQPASRSVLGSARRPGGPRGASARHTRGALRARRRQGDSSAPQRQLAPNSGGLGSGALPRPAR